MIMLCTMVSAWSYGTKTITLYCEAGGFDADASWKTTDSETGIYVAAPKAESIPCWQVDKYKPLQLIVPDGYIITGVKFNYFNKSYLEDHGISSSSINLCDELVLNGEIWEQKDGAFSRFNKISFRSNDAPAYVTSITVTYHKHTFTHNSALAATCMETGKKESWTCSDCGHTYYDDKGAKEVAKAEDLILPIDPTNHVEVLVEHARVEATCIKEGNVQYWHCSHCNKNFKDEDGTVETSNGDLVLSIDPTHHASTLTKTDAVAATCESTGNMEYWHCKDCGHTYYDDKGAKEVAKAEDLILPIDPTNHPDALEEHARTEATCIKDGNVQYWHCSHCNKNFGNENGTGDEIIDVIIPKEQGSHNHLSFVAQKDATCTESGVAMNHYHCSDCGKNFEDEACTKQITTDVTIPAINHKNKKFTEAVAPTTETEGNVAYWYCPDCDKHFGDEGCTKELTEWILEKLMNMMHLDFAGTATPIEAEHYLNTTKLNFTDDGDIILTVNDKSVTYDKDMIDKFTLSNGTPGVKLSANEDPDNTGTYYSTFYSSLESYAVPEGFTAYRGEISADGTKLNLTSVKDGVMTRGEGYILKGTASSDSIKVTENADGGSYDNILTGSDIAIDKLGANDYALSLGQNGVGFYLWDGKSIGANKAYLTLESPTMAKAFIFQFEDEITGINDPQLPTLNSQPTYNLNGVRVNDNYKGIVIRNGKKIYQK